MTFRTLALLSLSLALTACGGLFTDRNPAPVTYVLRPDFVAMPQTSLQGDPAATRGAAAAVLQLAPVVVAPGYATAALLVTRPDRRLDVFAASRWPDELPQVVGELALGALRGVARLEVYDAAAPVAATYMLRLSVRRFDAEYRREGVAPLVRIIIDGSVVRRRDRHVLGNFVAEATVPAGANRMSAIVEAFERAAGEALTVTAERTKQVIETSADGHGTATGGL